MQLQHYMDASVRGGFMPKFRPDSTRYTGIFLTVPDLDRDYESVSEKAILINEVNAKDPIRMEQLNKQLYVQFEGDILDTTPSCDCGRYRGEHLVGLVCKPTAKLNEGSYCYTEVASITERPLESQLWMTTPPGIQRLMVPRVWLLLSKFFESNSFNPLRWLADPTYHGGDERSVEIISRLKAGGWKRSYTFFVEHFDEAIDFLIRNKFGDAKKPIPRAHLQRYVELYRHLFFPKYVPIPNRTVFIVEKSPLGTWTDPTLSFGLNAVRTMCSIENSHIPMTTRQIENATIRTIIQLSDYYDQYVTRNISKKPGIARRQLAGGRLDFTSRSVISSLHGRHQYDELHIPWGVAIMMLKSHITSKLKFRGFTPRQSDELISLYTRRYHPLLDEIIQELMAESPYKGFPCILQRNPTLTIGSAQMLYITKVHTDVSINTFAMSVLVLAACNADYDGDELNLKLLLDREEHDAFYRLSPHLYVLDTQLPMRISGFLKIPEPVVQTIANFIHEFDEVS
jgi:hypothetical protein